MECEQRGLVHTYTSFQTICRPGGCGSFDENILAQAPMVPLWLDEGIAEYFEVPETERIRQHPHLKRVRRQVRWRSAPSLSKLESIGRLANMGNEEYEQAWSWVHFMLHGPTEARRELSDFLRQIQANSPPEPLSRRLPRVIPNVDREFRHHFRNLV